MVRLLLTLLVGLALLAGVQTLPSEAATKAAKVKALISKVIKSKNPKKTFYSLSKANRALIKKELTGGQATARSMMAMSNGATTRTSRWAWRKPASWAVFTGVVIVATWLFGALALMVLSFSSGLVLIVSGIRSTGWPRPVQVVAGALLVLLPIFVLIDMATGSFTVVVR